jgi:SAM-dependent methyltransferase
MTNTSNSDPLTVAGFGEEWAAFDQSDAPQIDLETQFAAYTKVFRWDLVNNESVGFDMGCGSGRWAKLLAPKVGHLHCIDASDQALSVARRNLSQLDNVSFHNVQVGDAPAQVGTGTMDFGMSLGVLHHVPDTRAGVRSCIQMLRIGAPFLLYLYYRFDNRPLWFRAIWRLSEIGRFVISRLPFPLRNAVASTIAALVYWPLARTARLLEKMGLSVFNFPLTAYRKQSFYFMRTDALDRFGTRLEQRFTRKEMEEMLRDAGCGEILFSDELPFWCVSAVRQK